MTTPKPLCFMVMPYGRKATQAEPGKGPAEIDFNALWDRAYVPVITELGYEPVRADQDTGALIVTQMLERLYFANLVLADMTIPNGNVYYEIGIRHAAQPTGCVMLAADWSRQLFDVAQMRTVRYPLPEGDVSEATAAAIRAAIKDAIGPLARGISPMHLSLPGYPGPVDKKAASTMRQQMEQQAAFQAELRAVRELPRAERLTRAQELIDSRKGALMTAPVAIALMLMLRDCADKAEDWNVMIGFIDGLPDDLKSLDEVVEQRALALSYAGWNVEAVAALEALVDSRGPSQERLGMLGGRYKRLYKQAATPEDQRRMLAKAIDHYERGMDLDLNEYYCASNLPALYRMRNRADDEKKAQAVLQRVIPACERARRRGVLDPWLNPTLLVAAFDAGDADTAEKLAAEVEDGDPANWQLASIVGALDNSLRAVKDEAARERLTDVFERLKTRA